MARYDNAYDETQADFSSLFGFEDRDLVTVIADNEAQIEAAGVDVHSYIAPGTEHTILARPSFYTLEVEGVPFADWVTRYVDGEPVEDVRCVDCQAP
jgi:hypothetical protein